MQRCSGVPTGHDCRLRVLKDGDCNLRVMVGGVVFNNYTMWLCRRGSWCDISVAFDEPHRRGRADSALKDGRFSSILSSSWCEISVTSFEPVAWTRRPSDNKVSR